MKADYYGSVLFIQGGETLEEFNKMYSEGKRIELLNYAEMWDDGQEEDVTSISRKKYNYPGDVVVEEDSEYVLIRNNAMGGHYNLLRKISQSQFEEDDERLDGELTEMLLKYENNLS